MECFPCTWSLHVAQTKHNEGLNSFPVTNVVPCVLLFPFERGLMPFLR